MGGTGGVFMLEDDLHAVAASNGNRPVTPVEGDAERVDVGAVIDHARVLRLLRRVPRGPRQFRSLTFSFA